MAMPETPNSLCLVLSHLQSSGAWRRKYIPAARLIAPESKNIGRMLSKRKIFSTVHLLSVE
jgi:hypothetical protein